jgi:plasmid stability protein
MAHLVLQDVDPRVVDALSARAERQGRSLEEEARALLEGALGLSRQRALDGARQLRARWAGRSLVPSDDLLRAGEPASSAQPAAPVPKVSSEPAASPAPSSSSALADDPGHSGSRSDR